MLDYRLADTQIAATILEKLDEDKFLRKIMFSN
jgi:hypothetical protein